MIEEDYRHVRESCPIIKDERKIHSDDVVSIPSLPNTRVLVWTSRTGPPMSGVDVNGVGRARFYGKDHIVSAKAFAEGFIDSLAWINEP